MTLSIPKSWTIITTAEFPSTVKENLPAVIAYEMDRLTPFTAEEALFDYMILQETADKLKVLVMAARTETVEPYLGALRENGFQVDRVTVSLSGLGTLLRHSDPGSDSLVLRIEEDFYEGALTSGGSLTSAFSQALPGADENAKVEIISAEISRRLGQARNGAKIQVVLWLKDRSQALKALLKLRISTPFKVLGDPETKLGFSSMRELPFAAVGGMIQSLSPRAGSLNLLRKGIIAPTKTPFIVTILLVLALCSLGVVYTVKPLEIESRRLEEIETQLTPKKAEVKKVEALKKEAEALEHEIATIKMFKESRPSSLNLSKELTTIIPKTTWLTRMRITETTSEIEGHSTSATELLPKLESSKLFRKAEFSSPTFRDAKTSKERFNIKMEIEGSTKLEDMVKKETKKPDEDVKKAPAKPVVQAAK